MAKKPKSKLRQEYDRQIKRLKGAISRYNKRGILFSEKTMDIVNKNPKRVTRKTIEHLKDIKPKQLLKDAEFVDVETGEIESAVEHLKVEKEARKQQRKEQKKNYPTVGYVDTIKEEIMNLIPDHKIYYKAGRKPYMKDFRPRKNALISVIDDAIAEYGEQAVEEYYRNNGGEISVNINGVMYDSDSDDVEIYFTRLASLLNVSDLSFERLTEIEELYES